MEVQSLQVGLPEPGNLCASWKGVVKNGVCSNSLNLKELSNGY